MDELAYERALEKVIEADRVKQEKMMKKVKIASAAITLGTYGLLTGYDYLRDPRNTMFEGRPASWYIGSMLKAFSGRMKPEDAYTISRMFGGDPLYRNRGFSY